MRKRLLILALALFAVLQTAWAYDFSATSPSGHTLYYKIISGTTNVGVVRPGTGLTYDNYVTGNVVIPATVTYGGTTYNVTELRSVNNYYGTFRNCSGLTSVTIPNSVTSIGSSAFEDCSGLTSVTIPNSVTSIGSSAFSGCTGLTSVTIPNSVTSIGYYAFSNCSGLTTLNFNAINCSNFTYNTSNYQYPPFYDCPISTINIGDSVQRIPAYFAYDLESLTSVIIGNSVTSIGRSAFSGCSGLTSVTIPNSVTSIGYYAFEDCTGLTTLNFNAINYGDFTYSNHPFSNCPITTINIGDSVQRIPAYFAYNRSSLSSITIPNSVTSIGSGAFEDCSGLTSVTIPNSVTSIGNYAFDGCSGLTSVTIGNSVTSIGDYAFNGCSGLTSVTIPNSVTSIGYYAFYNVRHIIYNGTATGSPWGALSVNGYIEDDFVYANNTKTVLKAYIGTSTSVTIPNSVTSIGDEAFYNCSGLTSVTIPNSVTSIGYHAFYNCSGLTSVTIPNSVTSIGNSAFYNVRHIIYNGTATGSPWGALSVNGYIEGDFVYANNTKTVLKAYIGTSTSVTIPNSVTSIGNSAFYKCTGLTSVTIGNSVTSIGDEAFRGCSGLTSVTIPNSVTYIEERAFYECSGLTSVTIGNSVTYIGERAFYECSGLTSVTIGNSVTSIGDYAFDGCSGLTTLNFNAINCSDFTYDYYSEYPPFYGCPISTINIGDSVQRIPTYFAYNLESLTSVTIGKSVISIGNYAFEDCTGLTTLNFNAINCGDFTYSNHPFSNCPITTINIGDSVQRIPAYFAYNRSSLTSVTIPNSVTSIGHWAFYECSGLTSVTIPNSVTSIGSDAFSGCSGLTSVTIPNSVTSIGNEAFYYCSGLTSVTIPNSVTSIGDEAFRGCSGLTSVTIGNSVTSIGDEAFRGCSGLTSVTIPNSVTSIGFAAFSGCSGLTSVTIGNSVTSIEESAFGGCSGLTSVTIGNSVTSIGYWAFSGCSGLTTLNFNAINCGDFSSSYPPFSNCPITTINIGDSVQRIPAYFAYGRNALTSVTIGNSVTSIGNNAFLGCSGLTTLNFNAINCGDFSSLSHPFYNCPIATINIGDSVQQIPACFAYNLESLTSVTIPNSVTSIGHWAFYECSGLTSVTIGNSVTTIGWRAFYYCSGLTSVTIGNSVTSIENGTFSGCSGLTSVTIPNSVTSIGNYAFYYCSGLTSVTIPNSVTSIGELAFSYCSGLTSVTIPNSVTSIEDDAFRGCSGLTSVTIPNSVTSIGDSAFYYCTGLTSVTIPNSVTSIGEGAFAYCYNLWNAYIKGTNPPSIENNTFSGNEDFYVPCQSVSSYQSALNWSNYSSHIYGKNFWEHSYNFVVNDSTLGSVSFTEIDCDSNVVVTVNENVGYRLIGWSDGGTGNPRTFHLTGDTMVTAILDYIRYSVIVQPNDTLRGTVIGSDTVYYGDTVVIAATANYGYHFSRWNDGNTNNPRTIVVTNDNVYTAIFDKNNYNIALSADTNIHGYMTGMGDYEYLDNRTISAVPNYGYHFTHWNDGDTNNPRVITLTQDTAFTAYFAKNTYTLTVLSNDSVLGEVSGSTVCEYLDTVSITATPNQGCRFVSWNDGNTDNPRTITVTEDATYIANFAEEGVGIESRDMLSELTFYPNPTSGIITFNRNDIMKVEVLDAMGRTVEVYENAYTIDISKLAKGYYAMRITTPEGVAVRKVIRK